MRSHATLVACALCIAVLGTGDAYAQIEVTFRQGVSPAATYAGAEDVAIVLPDTDPVQDPNANYNNATNVNNHVDGYPPKTQVLMRWDVSTIAPSTPVDSAEIVLNITDSSVNPFEFFEVLRPWVEGEVTWNRASTAQAWSLPGAREIGTDRDSVSLATFSPTATGTLSIPLNAAGVAMVQRWVNTPAQNFGVICQDFFISDRVSWDDSAEIFSSRRPLLRVVHSGGTTVEFQRGVKPTSSYAGFTDSVVAIGPDSGSMDSTGLSAVAGVANPSSSLLRFNVSSIPATAVIGEVRLQLDVTNATPTVGTFEVLRPWTEAATWATYDGTNAWSVAGGEGVGSDRSGVSLGTLDLSSRGVATQSLNASGVQLVQDWVSGAKTNNGIILVGDNTNYAFAYDSEEFVSSRRPALIVRYSGQPTTLIFSSQPTNGTVGTALAPPVTVTVQDAQGNVVEGAALSVTLALQNNPTGATLGGTLTQPVVAGVATFPDLTLNRIGSGYTLAASSGSLTAAVSSSFSIAAGADSTAPVGGIVNDGSGTDVDAQAGAPIQANWSGFSDPESGIAEYEWAIGSSYGGTQVQGFTSVGLNTNASSGIMVVTGMTYYVSVRARNGAGLTVTRFSDGVLIDGSVPTAGTVNDGAGADIDAQSSTTTLSANWSGFSAPSGISGYEWAIGTTAGGTQVQPFVSVGTSTSATATGLSLVSGTTYFVSVRATSGTGATVTSTSDGVLVDGSAPVAGNVSDGSGADVDEQTSTTALTANWSGFADAQSGITAYEWAIGTTAGGTQVQGFVSVGTATSGSATALTLSNGTTYFVTVRATNGAGLSVTSSSDGVLVDGSAPVAGTVNDGSAADVDAQASTTVLSANWSGFADAQSGIASYQWAIGTTPGGTEVQSFVSVGTSTSGSASGLTLSSGTTYYVTVRATNGTGLAVTSSSDGVLVDGSAPVAGSVNDGSAVDVDAQASTSGLSANWSGFADAQTGIANYEWAIGTTAGGTQVQAFASVGTATIASATGLTLSNGTTYFVTVRATNGTGLTVTASSDGVLVDGSAPVAGTVFDGSSGDVDAQTSTTVINANWSGFADAQTGITAYEWAIGTTAGGTQVQAFVSVGTATSGSATGLTLSNGTTYFVTVRATNGTGLSVTASSDGVLVDGTAPVAGTVNDGSAADVDAQASATVLSANWSGFADAQSGIVSYQWAIGTTPGGTEVQGFISVGTSTSGSASGLTLSNGTTYFVSVRATNGTGLTVTSSSDGVLVDGSGPVAGSVNDGNAADVDAQASTSGLSANWSGFADAQTGIANYEWAIGTTAGGTQVQAFVSVGTATSASATGLTLSNGTTYFVTVRATNGTGLTVTASSDGVVVDGSAPVAGTVFDGSAGDVDAQASTTTLSASWSGFSDAQSGITSYDWAIGTTAGGTQVQGFTAVGVSTSATANGLSLTSGTTYFITVRATNGTGLTATASSDGVLVDGSAPVAGFVNDGSAADIDGQASTTSLSANWSGFSDAQSGITTYEWAIGTTAGGTQVQGFTAVGVSTSASANGLSLTSGTTYFVTIRATNGTGLTATTSSDGVLVDGSAPVAGTVNDGSGADVDAQVSTTSLSANWSGFADAQSGITFYEWAIGTTAGGTQLQAFVPVSTASSASATGLTLSSGTTYFITVRATNGIGLTVTATSDGVFVDASAPVVGTVSDGSAGDVDAQTSTTVISANWSGFSDAQTGIAGYEWAIGTTAGGTQVQGFTAVGVSASASANGLSLTSGTTYFVTVRATNGTGLTVTASSDGVLVDGSAPVAGTVNDGAGADLDVQSSTTTLDASWSGFSDLESGISEYEWAIGTSAGATDVQGFVSVGTNTSASASGLTLTNGTTYFVTVRATSGAGQQISAVSDGVQVVVPYFSIRITGVPASTVVGRTLAAHLEILDGLGNVAAGYQGTVRFSSTDAAASLPPDHTFAPIDAGVFDATPIIFGTAGAQSLTVTDLANPALTATLAVQVDAFAAPVIVRDANLSGAVAVPYRYNAQGAIRAQGTAPLQFDRCGGPPEFRVDPLTGVVTWTPAAAGVQTVCVLARNSLGEDTYTFLVDVVTAAPAGPTAVANATPSSGPRTLTTNLDSSGSTGSSLMFRWEPRDGAPPYYEANPSHDYVLPGAYRPLLTVFDAFGSSDDAETSVTVFDREGRAPPSARIVASTTTGSDSLPVSFSCDCQAGDAPIVSTRWIFGPTTESFEAAPTQTFGPGGHHVRLIVTDANGLSSFDELELEVAQGTNMPPRCAAFADPPAGVAPLTTTFTSELGSDRQVIVSALWSLDGAPATSELQPSTTFDTPGVYRMRLEVQDDLGGTCADEVWVTVLSSAGVMPPAIQSAPQTATIACGVPYSTGPQAASGDAPRQWSLIDAPASASIDEASGEVSWTPSGADVGTHPITVQVRNEAGTSEQRLELTVECGGPRSLTVGCGCGATSAGSPFLIALLVFIWRARPRR